MPRSATTTDAFTAIAEPQRRAILGVLAHGDPHKAARGLMMGGERDVSWLVDHLGWPQPQVSKHLSVLRKVGLVRVQRQGKRRLYSLNGEKLKPVFEWVKMYERFWEHQLDRIKTRAEELERAAKPHG